MLLSDQEAGFGGFDRIELVMHRRGRTGQMPDAVHLDPQRFRHVVSDQLKARMADPLGDVGLATGEVVVEADHLFTGLHQPVHQMGTEETGTPGAQIARERSGHQRRTSCWLSCSRNSTTVLASP